MSSELVNYAHEVLAQACQSFPLGFTPKLIWKNLRVTAGVAYYREGAIALSKQILRDQDRLRETLLHEYAHLLAVRRHGLRAAGHGKAWKQAMIDLGLEPQVHHRYEVQRNKRRQEVGYRCDKCGITIVRARQLPRKRKYTHTDCGGPIRLAYVRQVTVSETAS